jgi:hypothetical protein
MVNGAIPIIAMERNGLGCNQGAEARRTDGLRTDHSKQIITHSALVSHDLKKHRTYQFMNVHFVRARRFTRRMVENLYKSTSCVLSVCVFSSEFSPKRDPNEPLVLIYGS